MAMGRSGAAVLRQRDLLTASLMGFTAGYTTSNTKVRFNTFGGMMTGNTVKLGISMQQGQWHWTGVYFLCVLLFALGTVGALYMLQRLGHARSQQVFLIVFCASFVLVDGLALAVDSTPEEYNIHASAISSIASFALGAQNLLSQKAGVVKANTTFMTGNIQKMAEALWNAYTKRNSGGLKPAERRAAILLFCTWIHYVAGGVCGAGMASFVTFHWSLTPVAVLYAAGMSSMLVEPPKPPKPNPADDAAAKPPAATAIPAAAAVPDIVERTPETLATGGVVTAIAPPVAAAASEVQIEVRP